MNVTKADVMLLETYLNEHWWRMRPKLVVHSTQGQPHGITLNWGSNGIALNMEDLRALLPVMDPDEQITPANFLRDYLFPFIRKHA
ncbi:hypothetical protein [Sphingomonas paucimobilis]|uniref:hypothetical protein n=1 Tax=Sphingomonas paucimobilis TaxID=13689 RepID=UPI0031D6B36D